MFQRSYYRTIWISDVHLGTRSCKASSLLDFLRRHIAETLYLVGDIVDGWNCGPSWHWSSAQQELVDEIERWRRGGVDVVFLPENHDEGKVGLVEELFGRISSVGSI
jgi:UDP-2,3-diacylglucosamine pyrophosphatase LpxH